MTSIFHKESFYGKIFLYLFFSFLLFIMAFRYAVGNDYSNYQENHYLWGQMNIGEILEAREPLFALLAAKIQNFHAFIFITSLLYAIALFMLAKEIVPLHRFYLFAAFYLINPYVWLMHLSAIRQSIAISLLIFAFLLFKRNDHRIASMSIAAASVFAHISAIFAIIIFLILWKCRNLPLNQCRFFFIVALTPYYVFLSNIHSFESVVFFSFYQFYLDEGFTAGGDKITFLLSLLISISILYFPIKNDSKLYWLMSLAAASIGIYAVGLGMLARISMYFDLFIPFLISRYDVDKKSTAAAIGSFLFALYLLRYMSFMSSDLYGGYFRNFDLIFFDD